MERIAIVVSKKDTASQLILSKINEIGPGPMGLGGRATALAIKIETAHCHTASLPVAVNIQCWANRSASATVRDEGWSID